MCLVERREREDKWRGPDHSNSEWKHGGKCEAIFWTKLPGQHSKLLNLFVLFFYVSFVNRISTYKAFFFSCFLVLILSSVFYFFSVLFWRNFFSFLLACAECFFSQTVSWVLFIYLFILFFKIILGSWTSCLLFF